MYVCMYVYIHACIMRLCVCGRAHTQVDGSMLMNFSTNDLTDICEVRFLGFWNFEIDDVIAAILHFFAALSRLQFYFDFLQNW